MSAIKKTKRKDIGAIGEDLAIDHLERNGYKIIDRNYKCRYGEIDLIASIDNKLIFIEVKLKKGIKYCKAIEAVNDPKQKKIIKSALTYIQKHKIENLDIRFDVIGIELGTRKKPKITHIPNAFEPTEMDFEER